MVILTLIILLFFKLYIKNINNKHLTLMLVIVFVLYETYFYKEHFQLEHDSSLFSHDFLEHKNKQQCIYENQEKITKDYNKESVKSVCYKINDLDQCNRTSNCKYDNELNKCIDVNIECEKDYKDISRIKCHYLDSQEKCNDLNQKLPDCFRLNDKDCEKSPHCYFDYSSNNCKFKKETCIGQNEDDCNENKDCLYKYYSDIYNISSDTNLKECHDYTKFLEFNKYFIERIIPNITLEEFEKLLNDNFKNVKFYGYRLDSNNKGSVYILNIRNLLSLSMDSKISLLEGLNKDKFIGNNNSIIIFEKKGICTNNKKMCKWKNYSSFKCSNISNKDDCNNEENCVYENDRCVNKGFCYDKCNLSNNKLDCENKKDLNNEKMCFWDNKSQKCLNNECLYNEEKC